MIDENNALPPAFSKVPNHHKVEAGTKAKHVPKKLSGVLSDTTVLSSIAKLWRGVTSTLDKLFQEIGGSVKTADKVVTSLTLSINVIKSFGLVGSSAKFVDALKEVKECKASSKSFFNVSQAALKATAAFLGIIVGGTAVVNILEFVEVIKTSKVMGRIPVIGSKLVTFFPFSSIVATIETTKALFELIISARSLHHLQQDKKELKERKALWKSDINTILINKTPQLDTIQAELSETESEESQAGSETESEDSATEPKKAQLDAKTAFLESEETRLKNKVQKIKDKLYLGKQASKEGTTKLATEKPDEAKPESLSPATLVKEKYSIYNAAKEEYKKQSISGKISRFFALRRKRREYEAAAKVVAPLKVRLARYTAALNKVSEKITKRAEDKKQYENLKQYLTSGKELSEKDQVSFNEFRNKKIEKWGLKLQHNKAHQAKEKRNIAFNTALIVILVASIILTATGVGALATSIVLGAGFLFITAFALTNHLIGKPKDPSWKPVKLPFIDLATA